MDLPNQMAQGEGNEVGSDAERTPTPQPERRLWESGNLAGLTSQEDSAKCGTPRQGGKRAPTAAQHWRHAHRRNRSQLPKGWGG
jgi:hypothetical protein